MLCAVSLCISFFIVSLLRHTIAFTNCSYLFIRYKNLVCFILLDLLVSLSMMAKMNFSLKSYTKQSMFGFLTADMQKNSLSFMLFWTLFYGLVYLF